MSAPQADLFAAGDGSARRAPGPGPGQRARVVALVDGNSFYASCEKAMDPSLAGRPVVVLSNNDGCAIARSPEAKALGIRMGEPWFRIRELCDREGVHVVSSNYALYGDLSRRVNEVYRQFTPEVETYSIDESFLDLTATPAGPAGLIGLAQDIRRAVFRATGIPTCVGLAPTKTLAKLANRVAKSNPHLNGVCDLVDPRAREAWLRRLPLSDVWGIGEARAERLNGLGLRTVADLRDMDRRHARQVMSVVGERTVRELRGEACLGLEEKAPRRKGLAVTRSFGTRVTTLDGAGQAVATHAARAAEKLRAQGLLAPEMRVFLSTGRHEPVPHGGSVTVRFPAATNDGVEMARAARAAVAGIYRPGYRYAKAGVVLDGLLVPAEAPGTLLPGRDTGRNGDLMRAVDAANKRFGRDSVFIASQGTARPWKTRFDRLSGVSTTRLDSLPRIDAGAPDLGAPRPGHATWSLALVAGASPAPALPKPPPARKPTTPAAVPAPQAAAEPPLLRPGTQPTPLGAKVVAAMRGRPPMRKSQVAALVGIGRGSAIRTVTRLAREGHLVEVTPGWYRPAGDGA